MCIVAAATVAAYMLDLFSNVAMNHEGHVVVMVLMICRLLLVVERHHFNQAKALLLRLLYKHPCGRGGSVIPATRGKPVPMHDCRCRNRHRVVRGFKHGESREDLRFSERAVRGGGFKRTDPDCFPTTPSCPCRNNQSRNWQPHCKLRQHHYQFHNWFRPNPLSSHLCGRGALLTEDKLRYSTDWHCQLINPFTV